MRIRLTYLIVLNALGLLLFGVLMLCAIFLAPLYVMEGYTELDRAQVINHDQLAAAYPDLAKNDRYLVPRWLAWPAVLTTEITSACALVLCGLNLVEGVAIASGSGRKPKPPAAGPGSP